MIHFDKSTPSAHVSGFINVLLFSSELSPTVSLSPTCPTLKGTKNMWELRSAQHNLISTINTLVRSGLVMVMWIMKFFR